MWFKGSGVDLRFSSSSLGKTQASLVLRTLLRRFNGLTCYLLNANVKCQQLLFCHTDGTDFTDISFSVFHLPYSSRRVPKTSITFFIAIYYVIYFFFSKALSADYCFGFAAWLVQEPFFERPVPISVLYIQGLRAVRNLWFKVHD